MLSCTATHRSFFTGPEGVAVGVGCQVSDVSNHLGPSCATSCFEFIDRLAAVGTVIGSDIGPNSLFQRQEKYHPVPPTIMQ